MVESVVKLKYARIEETARIGGAVTDAVVLLDPNAEERIIVMRGRAVVTDTFQIHKCKDGHEGSGSLRDALSSGAGASPEHRALLRAIAKAGGVETFSIASIATQCAG
jgi:hypothetical protein